MEITYGHRIQSDDDPYIEIAEGVNYIGTQSGIPGMSPVDVFPFRKLLCLSFTLEMFMWI